MPNMNRARAIAADLAERERSDAARDRALSRKTLSRWFANGSGHVTRYANSDTLLFTWNGKPDGAARYVPHVNRYTRNGVEFASLAALLRSVAAEHTS